jgi:hypothetical protein
VLCEALRGTYFERHMTRVGGWGWEMYLACSEHLEMRFGEITSTDGGSEV